MDPSVHNKYQEAIQRMDSLHANMAVLSRLSTLLRDVNTDVSDACKLIQSDANLTATIIRISNSAFYGSAEKCKDLYSALVKVGLNETLKLVGLALSKQVFMQDLKAYGLSADYFWSYSYFCATHMDMSAKRLGLEADNAYLIGLLHAIGRVIIDELLREDEVEIFWDPNIASWEWEEVMVGFQQQEAAHELLNGWKFDSKITDPIRQQVDSEAIASVPLLGLLNYIQNLASLTLSNEEGDVDLDPEHPVFQIGDNDPELMEADYNQVLATVQEIQKSLHTDG